MADLVETPQWEPGIYEFTTDDLVEGGPNGIDNLPTRQLANRTAYLKALCESLGLYKQPLDATLTAIAALTTAANKLVYATGVDTFATTDLTAFARTLLDDADAATMRATLGAAAIASPGLSGTPTAPTAVAGTNTTQLATTAFVAAAISALVNSSPATLDTLNELATALGNDPNFATTIATSLGNKQPIDATLTALAALTTAANKLVYATGVDTFATTDLTAFARTLLDDADAAAMKITLGIQNLDFSALLTASGYKKLPSGLIMQWGTISSASVTFPIAFTTALFAVNISWKDYNPGNAYSQYLGAYSSSLTGFTCIDGGSRSWVAFGR
ncbi:MAG: gp53-like domain-containing protein [Fluviibacter sp.]